MYTFVCPKYRKRYRTFPLYLEFTFLFYPAISTPNINPTESLWYDINILKITFDL